MEQQIKMTYTPDRVPSASSAIGSKNAISAQDVFSALSTQFTKDNIIKLETAHKGDPFIVVDVQKIVEIIKFLRDAPNFEFINLQVISAVDYPGSPGKAAVPSAGEGLPAVAEVLAIPARIEIVYILYSYSTKSQIMLKVMLSRDNPQIASINTLYRAANWYERECYDMLGVVFSGHPNLIRILTPQDWVGHPLRKDYVFPEEYNGMKVPL